jgi:hypothetical protein
LTVENTTFYCKVQSLHQSKERHDVIHLNKNILMKWNLIITTYFDDVVLFLSNVSPQVVETMSNQTDYKDFFSTGMSGLIRVRTDS